MSRYWTECTTVVVVCFISSTLALFQLPQADLSDGADLADYVSVSKCMSLKLALLLSFVVRNGGC